MRIKIKAVVFAVLIFFLSFSTLFAADLLFRIENKAYYAIENGDILVEVKMGKSISVPDYAWWYGCSPTSAGMLMGYYDVNGYLGQDFSNLVPGGVADMNTFGRPGALVNNIIASPEHIRDFWTGYGNKGDDPHPGYSHPFNCLADFMGTNQDRCGNSDGSTRFFFLLSGAKATIQVVKNAGFWHLSGMVGIADYVWSVGYGSALFNQSISGYDGNVQGFTWDDFKREIDAGRPVLIQLDGHTVIGFGYSGDSTVYIHDTWSNGLHTMTWGGVYQTNGMALRHIGVTCFSPFKR